MLSLPALFAGLIAPTIIAALPSTPPNAIELDKYPEFIPGPGFPSLAALNLTTEMLHTVPETFPTGKLAVRDECGNGQLVTANVDDVIVCFNFLVALGDYLVTVTKSDQSSGGLSSARDVATYNSAHIIAQDVTSHDVAATAYQIALGVQWSFTNCNSGGQVAGQAAAYSNGDVQVLTVGFE